MSKLTQSWISARCLALAAIVSFAPRAACAAITVDSAGDDAPGAPNKQCTLREAVTNAVDHAQTEPDCTTGGTTTDIAFDSHVAVVNLDPKLGPLQVGLDSDVVIHGPVTVTLPPGVTGVSQFFVDAGSRLELDDVVLENGNAVEGGLIRADGEIVMHGGAARLGHATLGGAIAVRDRATFSGVEFSANTARTGGAIEIDSTADVLIEDSQFFANGATDTGGAVSAVNGFGHLTIWRTSFIANRADSPLTGSGGALSIAGHGTVRIEDSIINRNVSTGPLGGAGAEFGVNARAQIVNTEFRDNQVESLKPTAVGGGFAHRGGALGSIDVARSNFSGNIAWVGGGAFVGPGSLLTIENTTLTGNFADPAGLPARPDSGSGAALYADSAAVEFRNVTVKDNAGVSQLSAHNAAELRFANTVAWAPQGVLNCDGQGARVNLTSSMQSPDAAGASCSLAVIASPASAVFDGPSTIFTSAAGPPMVAVSHEIWSPKSGGPLSKSGDKTTCSDPALVGGIDERELPRAVACDVGAIEGP